MAPADEPTYVESGFARWSPKRDREYRYLAYADGTSVMVWLPSYRPA